MISVVTCESDFVIAVGGLVERMIPCGPESANGAIGITSANVIVTGSAGRCEGAEVCIGSKDD